MNFICSTIIPYQSILILHAISIVMHPKTPASVVNRIPTGIRGFDELIHGGLVKNSVVLVQGDTGTTKTMFCLQYLYNGAAIYNEPGIFISFSESESAIMQHAKVFGWDMEELKKRKLFSFVKYSPHEVINVISEGGGSIRDTIESIGAKRLVIDSLTAYALFFENKYKANESILGLFEMLREWNTTSLVTAEVAVGLDHRREANLGFLTDGIVNMYHFRKGKDYQILRALEVVKMRDTKHNEDINLFEIDKDGIKIIGGIDAERRPSRK
jgi:KaiC/GvpD/RAD55 family RecA-like ATPase